MRASARPPGAALIGLGTVVLMLALAGCGRGGAASNGLIHVVNLGQADVSIRWQSPGVVGSSGSEPVAPCVDYSRGFAPGDQEIVITSATATARFTTTFTLSASADGQTVLWYAIDADGRIRSTTEAAFPASPFCASGPASPGVGSATGRPIDTSIVPVSRSKPLREAQAALNACGANGPKGVGVTDQFAVVGMGLVPHARDVPEYVDLWGVEPEIQTDDPAWVIQMGGRVDLGGGTSWADDPVCVVVDGRPTIFSPGTSGTATESHVPPTPSRSPTRALPALAP